MFVTTKRGSISLGVSVKKIELQTTGFMTARTLDCLQRIAKSGDKNSLEDSGRSCRLADIQA
jgi:hypothetical protein